MQLAILHYHLNRGGVTQAILNHLESLAQCDESRRPERVAIVSSGRREGWNDSKWRQMLPFDCRMVTVPALDYDTTVTADPAQLAEDLAHGLVEAGFELDSTVLHTHNHALGKNASLPGALAHLAERGCRLLLQVHDFAEDFRPANYRHMMRALRAKTAEELAGVLYPQGAGIHYATLTSRDHGLLAAAGVPDDRLHVLPNPIAEWQDLPAREDVRGTVMDNLGLSETARLVVYPVRGIRRKNVGEMMLHSALAGPEACYALTLAPENPAELASFDRWHTLRDELELRCRFGIGESDRYRAVPFLDALVAADAIITTSVAEGFGMVFLEAPLAGRPLVGRNLPEITKDFEESGLCFPGLHSEFRVPLEWLDKKQLRRELLDLHRWACMDFNTPPPADTEDTLDAMLSAESIDFAALPGVCQVQAITAATMDREGALEEVAAHNGGAESGFVTMFNGDGPEQPIEANAACVRKHYSPAAVGGRLADLYDAVMSDGPPGQTAPPSTGGAILNAFLRIDRLHPVRIET